MAEIMTAIGNGLVELYTRSGFGKVLKAEIDALVFHHLSSVKLAAMDAALVEDGSINYFRINKRHIHELSLALRTSEQVVVRLLEQDYLTRRAAEKTNEKTAVMRILFDITGSTGIKKENIKDGRLRFYVANPIVQKILQTEIYSIGGMVDCSFSRDILTKGGLANA